MNNYDKTVFSSQMTLGTLIDQINYALGEDYEREECPIVPSDLQCEQLARRVNDAVWAVIGDFVDDLIYEAESN